MVPVADDVPHDLRVGHPAKANAPQLPWGQRARQPKAQFQM